MRHCQRYITWFCIILLIASVVVIPVSANSAQSYWTGTTSTGAVVTDESCPITVESEILTFDIQEFPQQHYKEISEYLAYSGSVTAEYTFYNPADYTVNATLVFPFGTVPDYGHFYNKETEEHIWDSDTDKYEITVNGTPIKKVLRHTLTLFGSQFDLESDLGKLHDGYMKDEFYSPDLLVTKYTFLASDVDVETYNAATAAFQLSGDSEKTKVFMENHCGGSAMNDGVRLDTWVDLDEAFSVYVIGEPFVEFPEWRFYDNGACEDEIDGKMNLISMETLTMKEFALSEYDPESGILESDWYNAVVNSLKYFEGTCGVIHSTEMELDVSRNLMRWYQYEITLEPEEKITNTVTAPIYPSLDAGYESPVYEYTYLLSPAQTWKDFGSLDIIIHTPYYMTQSGTEGFAWTNPGYELHLNELPEGELTFTLCEEKEPTEPVRGYQLEGLLLGVVTIIVVVIVVFLIKRRRKERNVTD